MQRSSKWSSWKKRLDFKKVLWLGLIMICNTVILSSCFKGCDSKDSDEKGTQSQSSSQISSSTDTTTLTTQNGVQPMNKDATLDLSTDANGLSKTTTVITTSKGVVKFKFYPKEAPNTTKRFIELSQTGFYKGLAFHRVVPGFVIQGGDPKSKDRNDPLVGTGGSGQKLNAEFNSRKHIRGTVAMARSQDPNSADSQFYICLSAFPHLDGQYTVFGQIVDSGEKTDGKDILDRMVQWDTIENISFE